MSLSSWWRAQKEAARQDRFEKGFGYVMTAYYLKKQPVGYIMDCVYGGYERNDAFDQGAIEALRLLPLQDSDDPNSLP